MVKKTMYQKIQQLKKQGLNKSQIGRVLKLSRKTVRKYYGMSEADYQKYMAEMMYRDKKLDRLKKSILDLYSANKNQKMNMAAVYDYLEEKNGSLPCSENTLRYYIAYLVKTGELSFTDTPRTYIKVDQLPYGKQMQLDFGVYKQGTDLTLYIFTALLSSSRYKYVAVQDTPFTTESVIRSLLDTFDYFQGRPEELVIDQDRVMVVSENAGDILYTSAFEQFIHEMELSMYVCRKADPESKGKVENLVKFVKRNFLAVRTFSNLNEAQESLKLWLTRRANGKISQATKRIPSQEIEEERKSLRPVKNSIFRKDSVIHRENRLVSDKCLISYQASHYSVPSAYKNTVVDIYEAKEMLFIFDEVSGKQIGEHKLALLPGQVIGTREHKREKEKKVQELKQTILSLFKLPEWDRFCRENFIQFSRYVRDQCIIGRKYFSVPSIDMPLLSEALDFCLANSTVSFPDLISTYEHYGNQRQLEEKDPPAPSMLTGTRQESKLSVKKRPVAAYDSLISSQQEAPGEII